MGRCGGVDRAGVAWVSSLAPSWLPAITSSWCGVAGSAASVLAPVSAWVTASSRL